MGQFSKWSRFMKNITLVGQLGLTLVVPVLLCLLLCYYLTSHFGIGRWVYIPGFILGIGSSCTSAWKLYQSATADTEKKSGRDNPPSFNRHY